MTSLNELSINLTDDKDPFMPTNGQMRPVVILPEGTMNADNIALLNANGLCVVEAKNPALIKFLDPIPSMTGRTKIEQAAIALSRKLLNKETFYERSSNEYDHSLDRANIACMFVELLTSGTSLDPDKTQEEKDQAVFESAKHEELRRLAREEAREQRKAEKEKAAKEAADKAKSKTEAKK